MAELGEPTMFLHFSYRWMILDGKSTMKICREIQSCCFFLIDHGCFFMHKNRWYNGWMYQKKGGLMGISLQRSRKMGDEWHLGVIEDPWFFHMIAILNASESSPDHEVS